MNNIMQLSMRRNNRRRFRRRHPLQLLPFIIIVLFLIQQHPNNDVLLVKVVEAGLSVGGVSSTSECYSALQSSKPFEKNNDDGGANFNGDFLDKSHYVTFINILSNNAFTSFQNQEGTWDYFPVVDFYSLPKELQDNFWMLACGGGSGSGNSNGGSGGALTICNEAYIYVTGTGEGETATDQQTGYLYRVCSETELAIEIAMGNDANSINANHGVDGDATTTSTTTSTASSTKTTSTTTTSSTTTFSAGNETATIFTTTSIFHESKDHDVSKEEVQITVPSTTITAIAAATSSTAAAATTITASATSASATPPPPPENMDTINNNNTKQTISVTLSYKLLMTGQTATIIPSNMDADADADGDGGVNNIFSPLKDDLESAVGVWFVNFFMEEEFDEYDDGSSDGNTDVVGSLDGVDDGGVEAAGVVDGDIGPSASSTDKRKHHRHGNGHRSTHQPHHYYLRGLHGGGHEHTSQDQYEIGKNETGERRTRGRDTSSSTSSISGQWERRSVAVSIISEESEIETTISRIECNFSPSDTVMEQTVDHYCIQVDHDITLHFVGETNSSLIQDRIQIRFDESLPIDSEYLKSIPSRSRNDIRAVTPTDGSFDIEALADTTNLNDVDLSSPPLSPDEAEDFINVLQDNTNTNDSPNDNNDDKNEGPDPDVIGMVIGVTVAAIVAMGSFLLIRRQRNHSQRFLEEEKAKRDEEGTKPTHVIYATDCHSIQSGSKSSSLFGSHNSHELSLAYSDRSNSIGHASIAASIETDMIRSMNGGEFDSDSDDTFSEENKLHRSGTSGSTSEDRRRNYEDSFHLVGSDIDLTYSGLDLDACDELLFGRSASTNESEEKEEEKEDEQVEENSSQSESESDSDDSVEDSFAPVDDGQPNEDLMNSIMKIEEEEVSESSSEDDYEVDSDAEVEDDVVVAVLKKYSEPNRINAVKEPGFTQNDDNLHDSSRTQSDGDSDDESDYDTECDTDTEENSQITGYYSHSTATSSVTAESARHIDGLVQDGNWDGLAAMAAMYATGMISHENSSTSINSWKRQKDNAMDGTNIDLNSSSDTSSTSSAPSVGSATINEKQQMISYWEEVQTLVRRVMPDKADDIDGIIAEFEGREDDLLNTLRAMNDASIADNTISSEMHRKSRENASEQRHDSDDGSLDSPYDPPYRIKHNSSSNSSLHLSPERRRRPHPFSSSDNSSLSKSDQSSAHGSLGNLSITNEFLESAEDFKQTGERKAICNGSGLSDFSDYESSSSSN